uniref:DNA-directed RNA polymerase n=1 Tax=viral metagenome TaxID=1070528 RepID=A0A6C0AJ07_9ZZZZ
MEWDAIKTYFKNGVPRLVEHQVESFEDFVRNKIPLIVCSTAPIVVWHEQDEATKKYKYEFRLSFENISYTKPRIQEATGRIKPMFPQDARTRNFTYAAQMFSDIRFTVRSYKAPTYLEFEEEVKVFEGVSLGKVPVMLGSSLCIMNDYPLSKEEIGECPYDPFGYFLIHGSERTILSQEKVADNQIMIFWNKKTASKYTYSAEMKSLHESFTTPPKKLEVRISAKFNGFGYPLTMCVPRFREDIPMCVMFRAFGVESDKQIADLIWGTEADDRQIGMLSASFRECVDVKVFTREDAVEYLTHHLQYGTTQEDKKAYVRSLLETEYLPHVRFGGDKSSREVLEARKIVLTSWIVRKLLLTEMGVLKIDDRDAYPNKRVVTTGALLTHLFRQLFQKVCKDIRSKFVHEVNNDTWKKRETPRPLEVLNINNLYKILKVSTIEGKLKQALATGNFTVQGLGTSTVSTATKMGVSQVLNRLSYSATLSHVRRIQTPVEKSGKLLAPRKLHGTSWGYVCPVETPEGHSVGIVKSMSMLTSITQHSPSAIVLTFLKDQPGIEWVSTIKHYDGTMIILNGVVMGYTKTPSDIHTALRRGKQGFKLHPHTGISWNIYQQILNIETDGGRFVRPLFRVENGAILPRPEKSEEWTDWVRACIEYIDPAETEVIKIAMVPGEIGATHTHCEIHPTLVLGHMASSIPFSDHNQSPRNTYQSAMGKQAMGIFARNYAKRLDKNGYILCSPMRPFVETRMMNILNTHEMPSGDNVIVAIGIYGGYNQEDSVILNRASIDRGMFRTLYYTIYKDEEHRNVSSGKEEKFAKPRRENTRGFKTSAYHAIQDNGVPAMNSYIKENDVIIGKVVSLKNDANGYAFRDASTIHRNSETCRVDGVWNEKNSDGYPFVKVRVVSERIPEIGDKVSSRHGQKGTCGIILNEEDMPYTASGLRPDIIMNPHAVPSRMTIAQLMETMYGKICAEKGTLGDGTPYSHLKIGDLREQLLELGMHPYGNEIMYNGQTGEMMETELFIGPTFYQRLKHMVIDKKHSRSRGPIVSLTRQPCEGRSRDGGLRVGEMERDCMLSHGVAVFTKERLMDVSDPFRTGFCKTCGTLAVVNPDENVYHCGNCGLKTHFEMKTIPYAVKLWSQELEAMHIVPRMVFE